MTFKKGQLILLEYTAKIKDSGEVFETTNEDEAKHTPFTPALPVLYAYREAMRIILEEGMENRIQRHRICSDALYSGLSAIGLTPFADENSRSTVVIALNYLDGLEDKIFRDTLA